MGLTLKQEKFALAYLQSGNASAAYREAYDAKNMKPDVVNVKACELLKNGKVAVRLKELTAPAAKAAGLVAARTLQAIADAAYSTPEEPIRWADKLSALDKAAKIDGLYEKDNAQTSIPVSIKMVFE